jgi:hypothetical protein
MNAIVPAEPLVHGLVPVNMSEAMKLADMMAGAKLVPQALQKSPADCLMVIQQAIRWQMDPFAVAQECSVIQGKLMHSGKLVAAVVNARGNLANRLAFSYDGQGDERTITVTGRLHNEAEPRTVTVKLKDARTQNRVWQTQPDQQLMYHGVRVWARRHTPELMLGVHSPEEFDEPNSTPAKRPPRPAPLELAKPPHDPETGEIIEQPPLFPSTVADQPASEAEAPTADEAGTAPPWQAYTERWHSMLDEMSTPEQANDLAASWNSKVHKDERRKIQWPDGKLKELMDHVSRAIAGMQPAKESA